MFSSLGGQIGLGAQTQFTDTLFGRLEVAGTYYGNHSIDWSGGPYWDVIPSTVSVQAGVGMKLP